MTDAWDLHSLFYKAIYNHVDPKPESIKIDYWLPSLMGQDYDGSFMVKSSEGLFDISISRNGSTAIVLNHWALPRSVTDNL